MINNVNEHNGNNNQFDENLRQIKELRNQFGNESKFASGMIRVLGWDLEYVNAPSLSNSLEIQLLARINDFYSKSNKPFILDCGANIGISVLNYKRQYPGARIIAFEPDPNFLPVLRRNLERNGASDVQIVDAAVWIKDGEARWFCEGIDGSRIVNGKQNVTNTITVKTVDIAKYLSEEIDLVKMDIEGAEYDVIEHLSDKLDLVKNLIIECHFENSKIIPFGKLLGSLKSAGFSIAFNTYGQWRDLIRQPAPYYDIENYILVAAWKEMIKPDSTIKAFFPNIPFDIQETIYESNEQIVILNQAVVERDKQIEHLNQAVVERDRQIVSLRKQLNEIFRTKAWHLIQMYWKIRTSIIGH